MTASQIGILLRAARSIPCPECHLRHAISVCLSPGVFPRGNLKPEYGDALDESCTRGMETRDRV